MVLKVEQQGVLTSFLPLAVEFKKFLQRGSNSLYNFETPVVMKVCVNRPLKHGPESPGSDPSSALSSGLRAPSAAGTDPSRRRLLCKLPERVPADETDAGPQSDHGSPAEIPTVPHRRQTVGHVSVWLSPTGDASR